MRAVVFGGAVGGVLVIAAVLLARAPDNSPSVPAEREEMARLAHPQPSLTGSDASSDSGIREIRSLPVRPHSVDRVTLSTETAARAVEDLRAGMASLRVRFASGAVPQQPLRIRLAPVGGDASLLGAEGSAGRIDVPIQEEGTYRVRSLTVGKQRYEPPLPDVTLRAGGRSELVLEDPRSAVLRVVDAVSRLPLVGAKAFPSGHLALHSPDYDPPSSRQLDEHRISDHAGLISLPASWTSTVWRVRTDDHAWRTVEVVHGLTNPVEVALDRAGALRLQIEGWSNAHEPTIEISRSVVDAPFSLERLMSQQVHEDVKGLLQQLPSVISRKPDGKGELLVEGLPAGPFAVTIQTGGWLWKGEIYAFGSTEIRAGEVSELRLSIAPRVRTLVSVRGTIRLDAEWGVSSLELELSGEGDATAAIDEEQKVHLGANGVGRFEFASVPPGRYEIRMSSLPWETRLVVPDQGLDLPIVIPAPCWVEATVRSDRGDPLPHAEVEWSRFSPDGESDERSAKFDPARRCHRFRTLPGPVSIRAEADGYLSDSDDVPVTAVAGTTVPVELRLRQAATVLVRLRSRGEIVRARFSIRGEHLETEDRIAKRGWPWKGELRFTAQPGTWDLSLDPPDAFLPSRPQRVVLEVGKTTEVVFDLEPRK